MIFMIKQLLGDLFRKKKVKKSKGLTNEQCKEMCLNAVITSTCPKACNVCAYNNKFYEEKK
jgi:hypothetical protein